MKMPNTPFPSLIIHTQTPETALTGYLAFARTRQSPDIIEVNKDGEGITIEAIRALQTQLIEKPFIEDHRAFIVYFAETASIVVQNALLKSLEEPPHYVQLILVTELPNLLLPTIRSRCQLVINNSLKIPLGQLTTHNLPRRQAGSQPTTCLAGRQAHHSLSEVIVQAEQIKTKAEAMSTVYGLLEQKKELLEKQPSLQLIQQLHSLHTALEMLQANTNVKMCMEWVFLKLI